MSQLNRFDIKSVLLDPPDLTTKPALDDEEVLRRIGTVCLNTKSWSGKLTGRVAHLVVHPFTLLLSLTTNEVAPPFGAQRMGYEAVSF